MYLSNFQIQDKYLNTCIWKKMYLKNWDVFEKKANTFKYKIREYIVFKYMLNTLYLNTLYLNTLYWDVFKYNVLKTFCIWMYLNVLNINSEYKSNTVEYNASCQLSPTSSPRPPPSMRGGEADEQIHSKYTSNTNRIQRDSLILCSRREGASNTRQIQIEYNAIR